MPGAAYTGQLSAVGDPGSPDFDATSVTLAVGTGFVGELAQDQSEITEQGNIVTYTQLSASVNGTGVGSINGLSFTVTGGLVSVAPSHRGCWDLHDHGDVGGRCRRERVVDVHSYGHGHGSRSRPRPRDSRELFRPGHDCGVPGAWDLLACRHVRR